jgi:tetratricopeptide (TPR) repeat protein
MHPETSSSHFFGFEMNATVPPATDPGSIMQRAEEVDTIQALLSSAHTSAVMLVGEPSVGKSTLAALVYERLLLVKRQGRAGPHHLVWLRLGTYTTVADVIAAILSCINAAEAGLLLLKPEQQISLLLQALRRPQEHALIVLDQFEVFLSSKTDSRVAGRSPLSLFLDILQADLGDSRLILTSNHFPSEFQSAENPWVRLYHVPPLSIAEGVALLQQCGVTGTPDELFLAWQHCAGHVFALVLLSTFIYQSHIPLSTLLTAPDYQVVWRGNVLLNLLVLVCYQLTPMQYSILRTLSLFSESVPLQGIIAIIANGNEVVMESQKVRFAFEQTVHLLTELSLMQAFLSSSGICSYTIHSSLRQYIIEHYLEGTDQNAGSPDPTLNNPETLRTALAADYLRVAAYYQHGAEQQHPPDGQLRKQYTSLQDVEPVIAAIRYLYLAGRWQSACDLLFTDGLHERMVQWGAWNTLIDLYTSLLPPAGSLQRRDEGTIASHLGMLYDRLGEHSQSQSYYEMALTLQREMGDLRGEATTLINQGESLRVRGEWKQAHSNFAQAMVLNQQLQDPYLQCIVLHNLGLLYHDLKAYDDSLGYYHASLQLAYNLSQKEQSETMTYNLGTILTNLGMLLYTLKCRFEAMALFLAALELRQELHDPTVSGLQEFLTAIERKIGAQAYAQLCESALNIQQQVLAYFLESGE